MTIPDLPRVVSSTAGLTPNGILGYAKGIAAAVGAALLVLVPLLPLDSTVAHWVQAGIAVCGIVAVIAIPNPIEPVRVLPAIALPPAIDEVG